MTASASDSAPIACGKLQDMRPHAAPDARSRWAQAGRTQAGCKPRWKMACAALAVSAATLTAQAQTAKPSSPADEGQLALTHLPCLPTDDPIVTEVCGKFQLDWRFRVLASEPVEMYQLRWVLDTVKVESAPVPPAGEAAGRERASAQHWKVADLPKAVARSTERIEVVLRGLAMVKGASVGRRGIWVAVDSGVAARPNGRASYNVQSSPAWDEWLLSGRQEAPLLADVCQREQSSYLEAGDARNIFRGGMRLVSYTQCPQELASAREAGQALRKHCQSAPAQAAADSRPDLCRAFERTAAKDGRAASERKTAADPERETRAFSSRR